MNSSYVVWGRKINNADYWPMIDRMHNSCTSWSWIIESPVKKVLSFPELPFHFKSCQLSSISFERWSRRRRMAVILLRCITTIILKCCKKFLTSLLLFNELPLLQSKKSSTNSSYPIHCMEVSWIMPITMRILWRSTESLQLCSCSASLDNSVILFCIHIERCFSSWKITGWLRKCLVKWI